MKSGFTLLEVLVAVVLVGLVITAFFELLSGSLKLEYKVEQKVGEPSLARQAFERLLNMDVTDENFPWNGLAAGHPYELRLYAIELRPDKEQAEEQEISLNIPRELFEYELRFFENEERTKFLRLIRYKGYAPGHFSETFLENHLSNVEESSL